jgi:hypothetical protein
MNQVFRQAGGDVSAPRIGPRRYRDTSEAEPRVLSSRFEAQLRWCPVTAIRIIAQISCERPTVRSLRRQQRPRDLTRAQQDLRRRSRQGH